jgi:hypothetical protein
MDSSWSLKFSRKLQLLSQHIHLNAFFHFSASDALAETDLSYCGAWNALEHASELGQPVFGSL